MKCSLNSIPSSSLRISLLRIKGLSRKWDKFYSRATAGTEERLLHIWYTGWPAWGPRLCYAGNASWINSGRKKNGLMSPVPLQALSLPDVWPPSDLQLCLVRSEWLDMWLRTAKANLPNPHVFRKWCISLVLIPPCGFSLTTKNYLPSHSRLFFSLDVPCHQSHKPLHPHSLHCTLKENLFTPWMCSFIYSSLRHMLILLSSSASFWSEVNFHAPCIYRQLLPTHLGCKTILLSLHLFHL